MNLYDLFAIAARRSPGKAALRMPAMRADGAGAGAASPAAAIPAIEWSYGELLARAEGVAAGLRRRGIGLGDRVACLLGNGPDLVLLHLALLRVGAILVPINLAYRRREIGHILADAAPRLLVVEAAQGAVLDEVSAAERASLEAVLEAPVLRRWSELGLDTATASGTARKRVAEAAGSLQAAEAPEAAVIPGATEAVPAAGTAQSAQAPEAASAPARAPGGDDLAVLLYTSGTTGTSKGAMISHNNLLATVTGLLAAWNWRAGDVLLLALPLFHVHGLVVGLD
ncbi:MAG TPA: AMP-binding protein, partial [Thermoanaerobaculia bacterium]